MPEQIRCPECDATLRVPDNLLGKAVKCPKCQTTFTAELEAPEERERIVREPARPAPRRQRPAQEEEDEEELPPEEEDEEDRPRRRKRRRGRGRRSAEAAASLAGPAVSLMVVGGIDIFLGLFNVLGPLLGLSVLALLAPREAGKVAQDPGFAANMVSGPIQGVLNFVFGGVILFGAIKMKQVQNFGLALTASIMAMIPVVNCCCLGLPFGIWALVVLNKPEVKDAFS